MKKRKSYACICLIAGLLFSCSSNENKNNITSNVQQNSANIKLVATDEIPDVMYGDTIDFSKLVKVSSSVSGQVYNVSATSLTPDTLTIDANNLSSGLATGVGECKAKVTVLDKSVEISFTSHAHISSYKVNNPSELLVGDSFNLDDYVTAVVSKPSGAKGDYIATSLSQTTASIDEDGKTVHVIGSGKISIKIQDFTKKKVAYISSTAVTNFQKQIQNFASKIKNNYTVFSTVDEDSEFSSAYALYHTSDYTFYPYQFLLGTDTWGNKPPYRGVVSFESGTVYEVTADYLSNDPGFIDTSSIKISEKMQYGKDQYYCFDDFPIDVITGMKYSNVDGTDILSCTFTSSLNDKLLGNVMGISYSTGAISTVQCSLENILTGTSKEQVALIFTFVTAKGAKIKIAIGDIGTTKIDGLSEYLSDSSNEPESISYAPMKARIADIVNSKNYTLTGRSYVRDSNGDELTVAEAAAKAEILHLLYYTASAKYTEDSMYMKNIQSYKGVAGGTLADHQYTTGYMKKDDKIYEVTCEKDEKGNEILNGTLSRSTDPVLEDGNEITSYLDNSNLVTLNSIPESGYDDLNILSYNEENKTYSFNLKPTGKNGSELLRDIGLSCLYSSYPNQMFPANIGTNNYESGYFGDGTFTLTEDGGFEFFYYISVVSQVSSSGNVEYQMAIEVKCENVGSTTISEFDNL